MCEFCTQHGEGQQWYLQMKNYARDLLQQELSDEQKDVVGFETRLQWNHAFFESFVLPAVPGVVRQRSQPQSQESADDSARQPARVPPSKAEIVRRSQVEHFGQVLPMEDVEKVIDRVDSITRMPCGCRYNTTGRSDQRYCFGFGVDRLGLSGQYLDAASSLEVLRKEEARKIIRKFDQEGLMHSVWTGVTPYVIGLCNCDRDCGAYKGYIEMRGAPDFFRAEYICETDYDMCNGCKSCMSQCQFGAQFYSSSLGKVYIDPTRCFGCGVCRAACPSEAIRLVPRVSHLQAAQVWLDEMSR